MDNEIDKRVYYRLDGGLYVIGADEEQWVTHIHPALAQAGLEVVRWEVAPGTRVLTEGQAAIPALAMLDQVKDLSPEYKVAVAAMTLAGCLMMVRREMRAGLAEAMLEQVVHDVTQSLEAE